MNKRRDFLLFAIGLWVVLSIALFIFFPPVRPHDIPSRSHFLVITSFFCFSAIFSMLGGYLGYGWGLLGGSVFIVSFFALRFTSFSFLSSLPILMAAGTLTHFAVRSLNGKIKQTEISLERLETEENLLTEKEQKEKSHRPTLKRKLGRYASLSEFMNLLSASLVLKEVIQSAVREAYEVIGKSGGSLLFLVDEGEGNLSLASSFFVKDFPRTRSKKGDFFDQWVLKHRRPLLVRDVRKDFRFNPDEMEKRDIRSLMATPLVSGARMRGLLRLESLARDSYTSDDLRLLSIVGDLVASSVENARLAQRTEELARVDELTSLYVHRYFQERLQEELLRSQRNRTPLSLLMLDIDHFKTYNDRYGHIAGDLVLKQVAQTLKETSSAEGTICRYGGEEFSIILPERTKEEAFALSEAIRQRIEKEPFFLRREKTHVTLSIGVASFPEDGLVKEVLLKQVDGALYRAKREGRNRVCGS